ncbi:DUF4350 domain-containing protein [Intrasporangium sp.]|uniref:DUF4350 domain-containing protein n=1 Tax=Intrasporangium sp. TaxID=1925024 RepID=UPI00293A3A2A|nr:DUF4350 domain-containing protein [Intrasporangium sp.]MDV3222459.1 DUF4350 domain-containing protein [Intrasporangium sp.]
MTTQLPTAPLPLTPRPRRRWGLAALLAVAAVVAVALLALSTGGPAGSGRLADPESSRRQGARAIAEVLRQQGVDLEIVRTITDLEAARADRTTAVVIGSFDHLGEAAAERAIGHASTARRLVLLEPGDLALADLGVPLATAGGVRGSVTARCTSDLADPDDRLDTTTTLYRSSGSLDDRGPALPSGGTGCFADDDGSAALVILPAGSSRPETVVLGSASALTNAQVSEASHAAVGLRVLGAVQRLVWYLPSVTDLDVPDASGEHRPSDRGVPEWFAPGVVLVALAVVVLALARGRRLGRIVAEPLPVVVRAVETTEARGRLYRRASDHDRASTSLRAGARSRVSTRLGLPASTSTTAVVAAVARATGRASEDVRDVLYGAAPQNDTDLVLLAEQLAQLEEDVRRA